MFIEQKIPMEFSETYSQVSRNTTFTVEIFKNGYVDMIVNTSENNVHC